MSIINTAQYYYFFLFAANINETGNLSISYYGVCVRVRECVYVERLKLYKNWKFFCFVFIEFRFIFSCIIRFINNINNNNNLKKDMYVMFKLCIKFLNNIAFLNIIKKISIIIIINLSKK